MKRPPTDPGPSHTGGGDRERDLADSERAATHRATEDMAPGVIKDSRGEIQPDPYPDRTEHAGDVGPDLEVIEQHRADAQDLGHHRTDATKETLDTAAEPDGPGADHDGEPRS